MLSSSPVHTRRVFYISGYDPRGVRACHASCKEEAARYTGDTLAVSARKNAGEKASGWTITAENAGTETEFTFLQWDDIIRDNWPKEPVKLTLYAIRAYVMQGISGALWQALGCTKAIAAAALYPILTLIMMQLAGCVAGAAVYGAAHAATLPVWAAWGAGAGVYAFVLLSLYPVAEKIKAFWLLRIYIFFTNPKGSFSKTFDDRIDLFAHHIGEALSDSRYDEIIIISHSAGAVSGVSALARALRAHPGSDRGRVSMLTLGHCIPLHARDRRAQDFRDNIAYLSEQPFFWLDVSSPADGATYALSDPTHGKKADMRVISPQFHKAFPKDTYKRIKRDFFRMHFQYMMTTELPVPYDYMAILTGDMTLNTRYG